MSKWIPTETPYRVRRIYQGGPHGWRDSVKTYATLEEAMADLARPMKNGCHEAEVDFAENAAAFRDAGRWTRLASRKIWKQIMRSKAFFTHRAGRGSA